MLPDALTVSERVTICQNSAEPSAVQIDAMSPVMVMFHHRRGSAFVTPELLVEGDLLRT